MPHEHQFSQVFQFIPAPSVLLLPDAPKFTIAAANNAYLEAVNFKEEDLVGKGIFEVFPENPEDLISNGVENLRNSLNLVISKKDSHKLPLQKYNILNRGTSEHKVLYANIQNIPIKDKENNITHILHSIEDVTDKKILEIAFQTEKQRFNDLYLKAPYCMGILKGPNHVYEMANPPYLKLIGKKDIIGKSVNEIRPEAADQGTIEILDRVYKTGVAFSKNEKLMLLDKEKNGKIIELYQDILYLPHKDNTGKIDGISFFFIDVTEKVESRKKIKESKKRYRQLIQNLPVATYSCDAEGRILYYNKAAAALWGREPEIGKDKWCGSWKIYNENGIPLPMDMCPMAITLKEGRAIANQELIIERPNGDKLNVVPYPVPFLDSSGRVTGAVNVLIDITSRKKEEEKVRLQSDLLNIITQAAISTNAFGTINFWNKAATEIYGWTAEEALGKNVVSLISTERKEGDTMEIIEELSKGNSSNENEYVVKHKDGHTFSVFSSLSPIYGKQGKFEGTIEVSLDITVRKKEEEKLRKLNKELEFQNGEKENRAAELRRSNKELVKTNSELDHFVYSVSHDLRSPLTSILGLISLMEEESREPDTLEQVKMIRSSINRLDGFIKNILSYSQNNRTGLETVKIPVKKTIHEIVDSVSNIKDAEGISFQVNIDEKHPFYSDWQRLNTILENLITNAIKYHTEEVSGRYIKITGTTDNEELKLSISDNGIGIDPEFHDKIFDMFYRLSGTTPGSGFGLYIVKETLEKLHGTIEVQSEKGVGTTFIITLKNLKE
jgi:PAS domain S-box-containing protein